MESMTESELDWPDLIISEKEQPIFINISSLISFLRVLTSSKNDNMRFFLQR